MHTYKKYEKFLKNSKNINLFWNKVALDRITWFKKWDKTNSISFKSPVKINWFINGKLNASYNCIDRHLKNNSNKIAIIFEPDDSSSNSRYITYKELYTQVNKYANVLKNHGIKKGDRVLIYLPMIPEAIFSMLACARIGAIHSVVFGGFSSQSIYDRLEDCQAKLIITANEGKRGGKIIPLKHTVDQALNDTKFNNLPVLIIRNTNGLIKFNINRDFWMHDELMDVNSLCDPEYMDSNDPLFILYTSGSTGKPKGVVHGTGGYLTYVSYTHELVFDLKKDDIFWCTADIGWITGHSYIVYGPLINCSTIVLYEGVPSYPDNSRYWKIIDKHKVSIFYTSPTALRSIMKDGDNSLNNTSRTSLRVLGSVGEPINHEAWEWFYNKVGNKNCPIIDTWWQTETGGILISPIAFKTPMNKPSCATKPLYGIKYKIIKNNSKNEGSLLLSKSFPGQSITVYNNHQRFEDTYFSQNPNYYFTGDGCKIDKDNDIWITGRIDDVLNVSGHRIGTAELESILDSHQSINESAIVGYSHEIKGEGIFAFVTTNNLFNQNESSLVSELKQIIKDKIGSIAIPDFIIVVPHLPKTRSGKIMRRILRKIANKDYENIGDTSTLIDPSIIEDLIKKAS